MTSAEFRTALLLGSGEASAEVSAAFRRLGVAVITATDEELSSEGGIAELVATYGPEVIVPMTESVDVAALTEAEAAGVMVVPSARGCELTVTRDTLRRTANEVLGLPTTAYRFVSTHEDFLAAFAEMGLPCVVKPATFTGGHGHTVVRTPEQIEAAWEVSNLSEGRVMIERFVNFDYEVTVLAVRSIDPATGKLATWFCEPIGHRHQDGRLAESWQPMPMSPQALDNARSMAARISNALGGRGVCAVEMFVAGDEVYFSGVTPRPHEEGAVTLRSQRLSQYDLHARAILGLPIDVTMISPGAVAMVYEPLIDVARVLAVPETDVRLPSGRPGMVLATAETVQEARDRALLAAR